MQQYRSKPAIVVIRAVQFIAADRDKRVPPPPIFASYPRIYWYNTGQCWMLWVEKSKQWCKINDGDFIIEEPDHSGFYPCEQGIFTMRWEPVDA